MPPTLTPAPPARPLVAAVEPAAFLDVAARDPTDAHPVPNDADEPMETYSSRACRKDGTPMELVDRDAPARRWTCPACGSRRR